MTILQRAIAHLPPAVETPLEKFTPTQALAPNVTNILLNFENHLNQKMEEAITRRKNKGRPISIKEEPFTEKAMIVLFLSKFKELTDGFDGTTYLIDHIFIFEDRVRLH
ncbi:hypothetical protein Fot_29439 [Forsythia ovata]|uniref:Reverse transcriptase domain-containing protein n=1 Tax=Forsythia ovata TaxID=205694 RepID=A0ABD1TSC1_9LAMI